jgi:hypothetical protein
MVLKFFSSKDSKGVYLASIEPKLFAEVHISQIWKQTWTERRNWQTK